MTSTERQRNNKETVRSKDMSIKRISILIGILCFACQMWAEDNWNLVWREDFGVAEDTVIKDFPDPNSTVPNHCFMENERYCLQETQNPETYQMECTGGYACKAGAGKCGTINDGYYGITNSTHWAYNRWSECNQSAGHFIGGRDHTGNKNGAMLVINSGVGEGDAIFSKKIEFNLCDSRTYRFVIYVASITSYGSDTPDKDGNVSGGNANLELKIINSKTNKEIKNIKTGPIPFWVATGWGGEGSVSDAYAEREWSTYSCEFTASDGDVLDLQVVNWGNGYNDFAIDDISLYRNDGDINVVDPIISTNTLASGSTTAIDACIYKAAFSLTDDVLESWSKIYDKVYFLWQKSTDDGLTWENVMDVSGINQTKVEIEVNKDIPTVYRVIITGGSTEAVAESQALEIATNGAPKDGCAYYSISNTLAGVSPTPDCTYQEGLRTVWKEDFGLVDSLTTYSYDGAAATYYEYGNPNNEMKGGEYVITSAPDFSIKTDSWNKPSAMADYSGEVNGAFYYTYLVTATDEVNGDIMISKKVSGPFCKCKNFVFSYVFYSADQWGDGTMEARVLDDSGELLASTPYKINSENYEKWTRISVPFTLATDYTGGVTLQIVNTAGSNFYKHLGFDNLEILVCSESAPQGKIGIDKTSGKTALMNFDCNETPIHTIDVTDATAWKKQYANYGVAWQYSVDGGTWQYLSSKTSETYEDAEGSLINYRAVFAETQDAAEQAAKNGAPDDPCIVFGFSNSVALKCKVTGCKAPDFAFTAEDTINICSDTTQKIKLELTQQNKVNVDNMQWYSSPADKATWTAIAGETTATLEVLPTDSTDYMFIAVNDTCIDTVYARINVYTAITFEALNNQTLCEGESYTIQPVLLTGKPTVYIWNGTETSGSTSSYTIEEATAAVTVTFSATDGVCRSEEQTITVNVEKKYVPAWTKTDFTVCEGTAVPLAFTFSPDSATFAATHTSSWTKDGAAVSTNFSETFTADENCALKQTVSSAVCGDVESDFTIMVEKEATLSLSSDKEAVCNGDAVAFTITSDTPNGFSLMSYQTDATKAASEKDFSATDKSATESLSPTAETSYFLYIAEGVCPAVSSDTITISVDEPLDFTFADVPTTACEGEELTLEATSTGGEYVTAGWLKGEDAVTSENPLKFTDKPTESTSYTFKATSGQCPAFSKTIDVTLDKLTNLEIQADKESVCAGTVINLTAVYTTAPNVLGWEYSTDNVNFTNFSDEITTAKTFSNTTGVSALYFRLETEGNARCPKSWSKTIKVDVETPIEIEWPEDQTICEGSSLNFTFSDITEAERNLYTYSWKKDGTEVSTELDYSAEFNESAALDLTITSAVCPAIEHTFNVVVQKLVNLELTASDATICQGSSVTLTANYGTATSLVWVASPTTGAASQSDVSTDLTTTLTQKPETSTMYWIEYRGDAVCPQTRSSDFVLVEVEDSIDFEISGAVEAVCYGEAVNLTATQKQGLTDNHSWLKNDATFGSEYTLSDTPEESVVYTFSAKGTVCPEKKKDVSVIVEKTADLALTLSDTKICQGSDVTLNAEYGESTSLIWEESTDGKNYTTFDEGLAATKTQSPSKTTTYRLKSAATGVCEATYSEPQTVTVEDSISVELASVKPVICLGDEISLAATIKQGAKDNVVWNDGSADIATTLTKSVSPTASATYTFTAKGDVCEAVSKSVSVEVEVPTTLTLAASAKKICNGTDVTLTADYGTATAIAWESSTDGNQFSTFATDLTASLSQSPSKTTSYRLKTGATGVCPQVTSEIVKVEVEQPVSVSLPADAMICPETSQEISATVTGEPISLKWYSKEGDGAYSAASLNGTKVTVSPTATTSYKLEATADVCETADDEIIITVDEIPILDFALSAEEVCEGDGVDLSTSYEIPSNIKWWAKTSDETQFSQIGKAVVQLAVTPQVSTEYKVSATSAAGCPAGELTKSVTVDKAVTAATEDKQICEGDSVTLKATGYQSGYAIEWKTGSQTVGSTESVKVQPSESTTYSVTITNGLCEATTEATVTVISAPTITSCEEISVKTYQLTVESTIQPLYFNYGDGKGVTTSDLLENVTYGRTYNITVSNELGCSSSYTLETPTYEISIPEYFIPEEGKNWKVENLERYGDSYVQIFDRYGKKLYEFLGSDTEGWDGTYNGNKLPSTDYWYVINIGEVIKTYTGHFTLIRSK